MSALYYDPGPPALGQKVMLATTAYDSPDASYTHSIARTRQALGIQSAYLLLSGNCHVDDARNVVVRDFLGSDCTDLIFLDADVSWAPDALITLCGFDCDMVGGVYPYRREGKVENMPVRNLPGIFEPDENGLLEVAGLPTGFLRIKRHVLERMASVSPSWAKDNQGRIPLVFERDILEDGRRGGDIRFSMRWRDMGGKVHAAANLHLGHCGKHVIRDSLAACLRRQRGTTLNHVAGLIRDGKEAPETYSEAIKAIANPWGAQRDVLSLAVLLSRKADGPILEAGSGLSTILMAAATEQDVWCIEHNPAHALQLKSMVQLAGVDNVKLVTCGMKDGWYDLGEDMTALPDRFAVALVDGPPRLIGDRMKFFDVFGDRVSVVLLDDADDKDYAQMLESWADAKGRKVEFSEERAAIVTRSGIDDLIMSSAA